MITPNAIQIERWNEYEDALARAFFKSDLQPEEVVCEWEILGQADREVYVSAYCAGIYSAAPSRAVIQIRADGSIIDAEIPGAGTAYGVDIRRMFPPDRQEKIFIQPMDYYVSDACWRAIERSDRIHWRRGHPNDPPWIVFSALGIQPTQPVIPWVTPDPVQVSKWKEHQTALAKGFMGYLPPETVICEREFLGRSDNELYVWTICAEIGGVGTLEGLAVLYVGEDGSVLDVKTRIDFPSEIRDMFPLDGQDRYFKGLIHFQKLVDHLHWRQQGIFKNQH